MTQDELKQKVAEAALEYVKGCSVLGIGTGSTTRLFIDCLADIKKDIEGTVSSSIASTEQLKKLGIPVLELNDVGTLDIYVDGADEINPHKQLIKGGGAALTREKIIAAASKKFICIADETKCVDVLGKFPLPTVLVSALRAGQQRKREMLILGLLYAGGFLGIMGLSSLFDGGTFARLYLVGGTFTRETVLDSGFQTAMWVSTLLYLPLSALFWHAPALVHWHSQPAVKSIFFSLVAVLGNWRAMGIYVLTWLGMLGAVSMGLLLVASLAATWLIALDTANDAYDSQLLDPALAWTGVKDSGRGCTLSRLGYEHLTRPKSFHLRTKTS